MGRRTHEERTFAEPGPGDCPARHGGMAGFTLCELPADHDGPHRDTEPGGRVWLWDGMDEIAGCIPEANTDLTGRYERPPRLAPARPGRA